MKQYITAEDVFNEIGMIRVKFKGAILVLEGATDCRLFDAFVEPRTCMTMPAHFKANVMGAISLADARSIDGVLGLVDADFDRIAGIKPISANLIFTDYHDIEMVMLLSSVMERLILQYCRPDRLEEALSAHGNPSFLQKLISEANTIGLLRWINQRDRLYLRFKGLDFRSFFSATTLQLDEVLLIDSVLANSDAPSMSVASLAQLISTERRIGHDEHQLVCGHDVIQLLSIVLSGPIGACPPAVAHHRNIEAMCRMAFAVADFQATFIADGIRQWERDHPSFPILRRLSA